MNKREKLARALSDRRCPVGAHQEYKDLEWARNRGICLREIDAILAELREPDDRMIAAACEKTRHWEGDVSAIWQAMLDAISEDTKPAAPRERGKPQYLRYLDESTFYRKGTPE